nr:putative uncharacterized protein DDB_G0282133 [Hydra vulgaris]
MSNKTDIVYENKKNGLIILRCCGFWLHNVTKEQWGLIQANIKKGVFYLGNYFGKHIKRNDVILFYIKDAVSNCAGFVAIGQVCEDMEFNKTNVRVYDDRNLNRFITELSVISVLHNKCKMGDLNNVISSASTPIQSATKFSSQLLKGDGIFVKIPYSQLGLAILKKIVKINGKFDAQLYINKKPQMSKKTKLVSSEEIDTDSDSDISNDNDSYVRIGDCDSNFNNNDSDSNSNSDSDSGSNSDSGSDSGSNSDSGSDSGSNSNSDSNYNNNGNSDTGNCDNSNIDGYYNNSGIDSSCKNNSNTNSNCNNSDNDSDSDSDCGSKHSGSNSNSNDRDNDSGNCEDGFISNKSDNNSSKSVKSTKKPNNGNSDIDSGDLDDNTEIDSKFDSVIGSEIDSDSDDVKIVPNIPIMLIVCDNLRRSLKRLKQKKNKIKSVLNHFTYCKTCNITNNNPYEFNLTLSKIDESSIKFIVNDYDNALDYYLKGLPYPKKTNKEFVKIHLMTDNIHYSGDVLIEYSTKVKPIVEIIENKTLPNLTIKITSNKKTPKHDRPYI